VSATSIPGYDYAAAELPPSPVTPGDVELLKATLLWSDDDDRYLRLAGEVLADQVDDVLDLWYGYVASHPHLLHYFTDPGGEPIPEYLERVRARFAQWVRDVCTRPHRLGAGDPAALHGGLRVPHHRDHAVVPGRQGPRRRGRRGHAHRLVQGGGPPRVPVGAALRARRLVTGRLPDDELGPAGAPADLDAKLAAAIERAGQAIRVQLWDKAKEHGVTPTQLQVLLRLASDPPARRKVGAVAAELDVTHPTISDAGAPPALTSRGRALTGELATWHERTRRALADVPDADKQASLRFLLDLIAALQRAGVVSVARMCVTCRFFRPDAHPGDTRRHHCALVDMPMSDGELRVDCPEHVRAA
jgi:Protoglobin